MKVNKYLVLIAIMAQTQTLAQANPAYDGPWGSLQHSAPSAGHSAPSAIHGSASSHSGVPNYHSASPTRPNGKPYPSMRGGPYGSTTPKLPGGKARPNPGSSQSTGLQPPQGSNGWFIKNFHMYFSNGQWQLVPLKQQGNVLNPITPSNMMPARRGPAGLGIPNRKPIAQQGANIRPVTPAKNVQQAHQGKNILMPNSSPFQFTRSQKWSPNSSGLFRNP